jgi:3-deoxy-manno-octulosonate cytidylyltransferase (CMP-KDO synthetase)
MPKTKKKKSRKNKKIIGIIPARYGSKRLPGKALADIKGKPMIQWVYEKAMRSSYISRVIVATDDYRIYNAVNKFGGEAAITSKKHESGTDRIGEIARRTSWYKTPVEIVVNVQGDEPFISHRDIDRAIYALLKDDTLNVATLAVRLTRKSDIKDPNVVKVAFDKDGYALYFSRYAIPFDRDGAGNVKYYKHIGVYVYRKRYLMEFIRTYPTSLELAEKLEQLRALETGEKIKVIVIEKDTLSIDTKKDLEKARKMKYV